MRMNTYLKYFVNFTSYKLRARVLLVVALMIPATTKAETYTLPDAGFSIEMFAPAEIEAGESLTIYARVHNIGDQSLEYPAIRRDSKNAGDIVAGYRFLPCEFDCISSPEIAPGQTIYLTVGTLYYVDSYLNAGELLIDNFQFRYLSRQKFSNEFVDLSQQVSVRVVHTSDVKLNPALQVQSREALQIHDLSDVGDASRLHDPNTGNDWIRFDATVSLVAEEILAALAPGGRFEHYELARISQVEELVMNHLHASGLTVPIPDGLASSNTEVVSALLEFMELMQHTSSSGDLHVVEGAVADGRIYRAGPTESIGGLRLLVNLGLECGCGDYKAGMVRARYLLQTWDSPQSIAGIWLVKTPEKNRGRPINKASFFDNELVIPAVHIDGADYRVTMRLIDSQFQLLRIASVEPAAEAMPLVYFDNNSRSVSIPEVVLMDDENGSSIVSITLALVEMTGDTIMQVVQLNE